MFVLFKQIHESLHFEMNEKEAKKKEEDEEEEEEDGGRKNRYSLILTHGRSHYEHMNDS